MLEARNYKGISYIQLSDLTPDELASVRQWSRSGQIIKILIDNKIVEGMQYKCYKLWYEENHGKEAFAEPAQKVTKKNVVYRLNWGS